MTFTKKSLLISSFMNEFLQTYKLNCLQSDFLISAETKWNHQFNKSSNLYDAPQSSMIQFIKSLTFSHTVLWYLQTTFNSFPDYSYSSTIISCNKQNNNNYLRNFLTQTITHQSMQISSIIYRLSYVGTTNSTHSTPENKNNHTTIT